MSGAHPFDAVQGRARQSRQKPVAKRRSLSLKPGVLWLSQQPRRLMCAGLRQLAHLLQSARMHVCIGSVSVVSAPTCSRTRAQRALF